MQCLLMYDRQLIWHVDSCRAGHGGSTHSGTAVLDSILISLPSALYEVDSRGRRLLSSSSHLHIHCLTLSALRSFTVDVVRHLRPSVVYPRSQPRGECVARKLAAFPVIFFTFIVMYTLIRSRFPCMSPISSPRRSGLVVVTSSPGLDLRHTAVPVLFYHITSHTYEL